MQGTQDWVEEARADWQEYYKQRLVSAEEAMSHIKSGDNIYIATGMRVGVLIAALLGRADELENVEIKVNPFMDFGWYSDIFQGHISMNVLYLSPGSGARQPVQERRIDYTPWMVFQGHKALDEGRLEARRVDVNLVVVSPPNAAGYVCFGSSVWDAKSTIKRAKMTIAVVNEYTLHTWGDTWSHVSEFDYFVEDHQEPPGRQASIYTEPAPEDQAIAGHVASLINDGDTFQIGFGSATGSIPRAGVLDNKHDLGYFSELTVPGTVELVKKGVITGKHMNIHTGKFVTTSAGGSGPDREFIKDNPMFEFYGVEYMHDPRVISRNDNMKAINQAVSVDLTGQIAATHIGPLTFSGTGGHLSYALGAFMSRGGRYICVLPSTSVGGTVSRIVPRLAEGQIVTVPRDVADTVVTEYGIARLLNKTERERANELIAVAHPDHRAELKKAAQKFFWP